MSALTQEQAEALARRAVACPGWRWMPGMATLAGDIVVEVEVKLAGEGLVSGLPCAYRPSGHRWYLQVLPDDTLPDLRWPSSLGYLLALVRKAWRDPEAHAYPLYGGWSVMVLQHFEYISGPFSLGWVEDEGDTPLGRTEAEALIAALEAAPGGGV